MANGLLGGRAIDKGLIREGTPDPMGRALSTTMIEGGFATLGAALAKRLDNPAIGESFARQGAAVAQTLRKQWWEQEKKHFDAIHGQPIREQLLAAQTQYEQNTKIVPLPPTPQDEAQAADPTLPPPSPRWGYRQIDPVTGEPTFISMEDPMMAAQYYNEQTQKLVGTLMNASLQYFDAASQFSNNPLIAQDAQNLMQHISGSFAARLQGQQMASKQMEMQGEAQRQDLAASREQRAQEMHDVNLREADMRSRKAGLELEAAEYNLENAEAEAKARADFGRELAIAQGAPPEAVEAMTDEEALVGYNLHQERHKEKLRKLETGRGGLVPPTLPVEALPQWIMASPEGHAHLSHAQNLVTDQFLMDPEIGQQVAMTIAQGVKDEVILGADKQSALYSQYYMNATPETREAIDGALAGSTEAYSQLDQNGKAMVDLIIKRTEKKLRDPAERRAVGQHLMASDPDLRAQLLQASQATALYNVVSMSSNLQDQLNVKQYGGVESALRIIYPEVYGQYQDDAKVKGPQTQVSTEPDPEIVQTVITDVDNIASWVDEIGRDPKIPENKKKEQAKNGIRRIEVALHALSQKYNSAPDEMTLTQYLDASGDLLALKKDLEAILEGKLQTYHDPELTKQELLGARTILTEAYDAGIETYDMVDGYVNPEMQRQAGLTEDARPQMRQETELPPGVSAESVPPEVRGLLR